MGREREEREREGKDFGGGKREVRGKKSDREGWEEGRRKGRGASPQTSALDPPAHIGIERK